MSDVGPLNRAVADGGTEGASAHRPARLARETRALFLLAGLFAAALLLIGVTVYTASQRQDALQREHEERIVAAGLGTLERAVSGNVADYAGWDDAVRHLVLAFDPAWAARNIGPNIQTALGYDASLLVDGEGRAVYGQVDGVEDAGHAAEVLGPAMARLAGQARREARVPPEPATAILGGPEGLLSAAASAVVPEEDSALAPPPGPPSVLLFAKRLDVAFLRRLEDDFGLNGLALVGRDAPASSPAEVVLSGPEAAVAGRIAWQPGRPGSRQLAWLAPALAGALLAVGVFAGLGLRGLRLAAAIRASEARLRELAEVSSDWFWQTDEAHRFTWLSDHFHSATGLVPDGLIGTPRGSRRLGGPEDDDWEAHLADIAARRPFRDFAVAFTDAQGRRRVARTSGRPVLDADGRFSGYLGSGHDITEEWEAHQRLRESEGLFRSLVENLRGIVFCRGAAGSGPYGYDDQGLKVFGVDAPQLAGTVDERQRAKLATWYDAVHPDDRPAYIAAEERRKALHEPYALDFRFIHPGTGEERWMREVAWVVEDAASGRTYLDSYIVDITEQKDVEAAIEIKGRENEVYKAIFETLPDQVYYKDADQRFVVANAATARLIGIDNPIWLVGRTDLGLSELGLLASATALRFHEDERRVLASGAPAYLEQSTIGLDGTKAWIGVLKVPVRDERGAISGLVGHGRDITEQKRREAALAEAHARLEEQNLELQEARRAAEAASRAKSDFLAAMSHEIRTPMTAVLGMADLLAAATLPKREHGHVQAIRTSGRHLLSIINDILDFSRIEAGRLELERIDFSVAEFVERVRSIMMPQAAERGLALEFALDGRVPPVIRGDPTRLQQVLLNLVGNALKFTSRGTVAVTVRPEPGAGAATRLRLEVRDTGIGIPRERQAALFEAFSQADASTTRHYGGSGLGLAICKRLTEAMGGSIGVDSAPGEGSLFWFEVALEPGDVAVAAERAAFEPVSVRPLRILVAEDVELNRELLGEMLGRHGHRLAFAVNGAEAVELATRGDHDLVLMDVQMPVMDGVEAARRIRALPGPAGRVPVVALTANVMEAERQRCLAAGMDRVLAKPIAWTELFAAMAALVAGEDGAGSEPPPDARGGHAGGEPPARERGAEAVERRPGRRRSLRWRFVVLGSCVLAPLSAIMLYFAGAERQAALGSARERASALVALAAQSQHETVDQAHALLAYLADLPEVRAGGEVCDAYLARVKRLHGWISSLRTTDAAGRGRCADRAEIRDVNIADRGYFRQAVASRDFVLSDLIIGAVSGRPTVIAVLPILDGGTLAGAVTVGIDLSMFARLPSLGGVDQNLEMLVVDTTGALIAHQPPLPELTGQALRGQPVVDHALDRRGGTATLPGLSGAARLFAFQELPGTGAVLAVGLDVASIVGPINAELRQRLSLIVAVILGAVAVGAAGGELFIFRPLRGLVETAWRIQQGELHAGPPNRGAGEISDLSRALRRMAGAIAERENRLRDGEARYRILAENATDMIVQTDAAGRRSYVSPASLAVLGYAPEELIGTKAIEFTHPDDRDRLTGVLQGLGSGELEQATSTQRFRRKDGSWVWVEARLRLVRDVATGAPAGIVSAVRDISERHAQAEELALARDAAEAADRAKSDFLATMSHEIRTPMTAVLGMADLLAAEDLDPRQMGYVSSIRNSGRHLLSVINDILDFSRIEAGRLELERIDFSVAEILEQLRSLTSPQAVERGLELTFRLDEHSPPVVRGDPTRLNQILLNLVGNALKFTSRGTVTVTAGSIPVAERLARFRFEVRDTGIGIPRDRQAMLFEPFAQAESSTARRYGGSGLGLAICRHLVVAMGGEIGFESEPEQGSLFWVEIPFEVGDAVVAAERATFDLASLPALRVLVAEDVPLNQDLLREMLGRHGHRVTIAVNGAEAVELATRGDHDLVLMDVQMPVMDGVEAARRIRALPGPAGRVPVVALTANVTGVEHRRCEEAGMDRVLTKPIAWTDLFATMLTLTSRRAEAGAQTDPDVVAEPEAEAAEPPDPEPVRVDVAPAAPSRPTLDRDRIAALRQDLGPEAMAGLLDRVVSEAARAQTELVGLRPGTDEMRRVAHRLRGTAGSFGLPLIQEIAGDLEEGKGGEEPAALIARLGEAVAATRAALDG